MEFKTAIFIPTLSRPGSMDRVFYNIRENTTPKTYEIYFICEPTDSPSIEKAFSLGLTPLINKKSACYADAINTAYRETAEPYFLTGADDLGFYKGWLENAHSHMIKGVGVVGTNDLGNIPIGEARESTHYLVARDYIKKWSGVIDRPNTVLYPYIHNYTDKEFIETAKKRNTYKYCPESILEHFHWAWGKGQMDDVYRKGLTTSSQDEALYNSRQHLWQ